MSRATDSPLCWRLDFPVGPATRPRAAAPAHWPSALLVACAADLPASPCHSSSLPTPAHFVQLSPSFLSAFPFRCSFVSFLPFILSLLDKNFVGKRQGGVPWGHPV